MQSRTPDHGLRPTFRQFLFSKSSPPSDSRSVFLCKFWMSTSNCWILCIFNLTLNWNKQFKRTHLLPKMLRSCAKLKRLYSKVCRAIAQKCSKRSSTMTTALSRWKLSCDVSQNDMKSWWNYGITRNLRNQLWQHSANSHGFKWIHGSAALRMQRNHSIEPSKDPFCGLVMSCAAICCPKCLKHSMLEW